MLSVNTLLETHSSTGVSLDRNARHRSGLRTCVLKNMQSVTLPDDYNKD